MNVKLLFCFVILICTNVHAQNHATVNKPVICAPIEVIFKGLADKDINEKPVWQGSRDDKKTDFYLFLNFETSAFTIVETGKEIGCILGIGYNSNFFDPPKSETKKLNLPIHDSQH